MHDAIFRLFYKLVVEVSILRMISTRLFVLVSLLSLTVAQEKYADCFTNYSVLEQAVLNTGDNRFEIIKAFYPPDSSFPSVYVTVM